jgi:hypothetical protein
MPGLTIFQQFADYQTRADISVAGELAYSMSRTAPNLFTKFNTGGQSKQTIATQTIAGTIATGDTVTATFTGTNKLGTGFTKAITVTAIAAETATTLAAKLVTAINADEDVNDVLRASNAAGVLTYTIRDFGVNPITSVAGSATGTTTFTASPVITPAGFAGSVNFGYVVGRYAAQSDNACAAVTTAAGLTVLGIATRRYKTESNYPYNPLAATAYLANDMVEYVRGDGFIYVPTFNAVARDTVPAFLNATGQICATGTASSTPLPNSLFHSSTAAAGLAIVEINLI